MSAFDKAAAGDLPFFQGLGEPELQALVRKRDEDARSVLHVACTQPIPGLPDFFLQTPSLACLIDQSDEEGWTPLMSASSSGHEAVVASLLRSGAQLHLANSSGRTALHYAASKGWSGIVRLLLQHGAPVAAQDCTGATPLHRASAAGKVDALGVLVREGRAPLEARDRQGASALYAAVQADQAQAAYLLAACGADLDAATKDGDTPLRLSGENAAALRQAAARGKGGVDEPME